MKTVNNLIGVACLGLVVTGCLSQEEAFRCPLTDQGVCDSLTHVDQLVDAGLLGEKQKSDVSQFSLSELPIDVELLSASKFDINTRPSYRIYMSQQKGGRGAVASREIVIYPTMT